MLIPELLLLLYFCYVVFYTLTCSTAGFFYTSPRNVKSNQNRFCVLIPAYKEDAVIPETARLSLNQTYPKELFDVVVIADSLQINTLNTLKKLPIQVVEVTFESSTKVKALNVALQSVKGEYDFAVILDADNVMLPDFLEKINSIHTTGAMAVQGQRIPKNTDNSLSLLDGLSETINNHIYRQGTGALGLSVSISGSGVSFHFKTLKALLSTMTSIGGFDRELELLLLEKGINVVYSKEAKVQDEKVQKDNVFENQRKRWIYSQYFYLAKYFGKGCKALLKGDFTYFNSAVLRNIQLPRLINIGLLVFFTFVFFFLRDYLFFSYLIWPVLLSLMIIAMIMAIPREYYSKELLKAVFKIPGLFLRMFLLLFKLKGANKKFIHTPHGVASKSHD